MTISITLRRAAAAIAMLAATTLLSACVVTSETSLVSPGEGLTDVLPASFTMTTYSERDGVYVKSEDGPGTFTLKDGGYVAPDGSLTAYFIGIEDPDYYLIATVAKDGTMYGAVSVRSDDIMEIRMVFDGDPAEADVSLPPTVTFADGGIMVTSRAEVEAVFAAIANGSLPTQPLIAYVGSGTPPATIVKDGDWYRAE